MKDSKFEHPVILETLGVGVFLTVAGWLGSYLLPQSFSPALLSIALVFVLAQLSAVIIFHFHNQEEAGTRRKKFLWRAFIVLGLVLLLAFIMGMRQWSKETKGGTLVIYVDAGATSMPKHIKVHRGFPRLFAFLDHPRTVELDTIHNKFSASDLRCGRWYVSPQPESEYTEFGPIIIPAIEPRKAERRNSFEKKLCSFSLKTFDEAGALLEGATIQLKPAPRGVNRTLITPEFISLEVGVYEVSFSLQGYQDPPPIQRSCFPETREEIHITLGRTAESQSAAGVPGIVDVPSQKAPRVPVPKIPVAKPPEFHQKTRVAKVDEENNEHLADPGREPDVEVPEVVREKELNKVSLEVESLLKDGDGKGAIERLKIFTRKYPGTKQSREAEQIIEKIKNLERER